MSKVIRSGPFHTVMTLVSIAVTLNVTVYRAGSRPTPAEIKISRRCGLILEPLTNM